MRLRDHPKLGWPPVWSTEAAGTSVPESGILKEIELIEKDEVGPRRLLLAAELGGQVCFAEVTCNNEVFAYRLYEKIKPFCGREIKEIGDIEIDD